MDFVFISPYINFVRSFDGIEFNKLCRNGIFACRSHSTSSVFQGLRARTICYECAIPAYVLSRFFSIAKLFTIFCGPIVLECASLDGEQIRIIVNDGVSPLTGIRGCPKQKDGMCPLDTFVAAQKETIGATDWINACYGNWEIPDGWETMTGEPPKAEGVRR